MLEFSKLAVAFAVELGGVQYKWDPGHLLDNLCSITYGRFTEQFVPYNPFIYLCCENQLLGI